MYKAIVNTTTGEVYWRGDGIHWVPNTYPAGFSVVDIDATLPRDYGEDEKYVYDEPSNTISIVTLPSLDYEGRTNSYSARHQ